MLELVTNQEYLGFYNRLYLAPKPNNKWRPILDLSNLNKFLKVKKFKMETPETIRTSLQTGEWVTSTDFKDAYFHIPIQKQSRKYLRFHAQGKTYQFKALPFGLSTAALEFTDVAKEVKVMALQSTSIPLCNILTYVSSINTWASGDSPLAQLVKELDLCLYLCVIRRLQVRDAAEPINNLPSHYMVRCLKILPSQSQASKV